MTGHQMPIRSARVNAPTDRHQLVLVASPPRIGYPQTDPHQIVSAGEDVLTLQCAGGDLMGTVVIEHHAAQPGDISPPAGADGEPGAVSEVSWLINSGHLIVDNYDLGFEVVPDLGISPGLWKVRAAAWGLDLAAETEAQWDERLLTDPDALDPDRADTPLSPEIWLVQMWPEPDADEVKSPEA